MPSRLGTGKSLTFFYSVVFLFGRVASDPFEEPDLSPVDLRLFCGNVLYVYLDSDPSDLDFAFKTDNFPEVELLTCLFFCKRNLMVIHFSK